MILIKDRHLKSISPFFLFIHGKYDTYKGSTHKEQNYRIYNHIYGKYDTYKGSTPKNRNVRIWTFQGNMILIKDRHLIESTTSSGIKGKYDTYKGSTLAIHWLRTWNATWEI